MSPFIDAEKWGGHGHSGRPYAAGPGGRWGHPQCDMLHGGHCAWLAVEMPWFAQGGPIFVLVAQTGLENATLTL